jgi:hypothetical protein
MTEWATLTPDGRTLRVRHEKDTWIAKCNDVEEARNELLDVAADRGDSRRRDRHRSFAST